MAEPSAANGAADAAGAAAAGAAAASGSTEAATGIVPGKHVEIVGTAMAGSLGIAEDFLEAKGRWKVTFASGVSKNFKAESLKLVPEGKAPKTQLRRPQESASFASDVDAGGNMDRGSRRADKKLPYVGGLMDVLSRVQSENEARPDVAHLPRVESAAPSAVGAPPAAVEQAAPVLLAAAALAVACSPQASAPAANGGGGAASGEAAAGEAAAAAAEAGPTANALQQAQDAGAGSVNLAGRAFEGRAALVEHIKAMQARLDEKGGVPGTAGMLDGQDRFLFFHLALRHPATASKMKAPLRGIRYGVHHLFPKAKCFVLVFHDGNEEPISWTKCVKEVFSGTSAEAAAAGAKRPGETVPGAGGKKAKVAREPE